MAALVESTHGMLQFTAPITAITAAMVGVITSFALFFIVHITYQTGARGLFDMSIDFADLTLVALAALTLPRFEWGVIPVTAACALAGLGLRMLGLT